MASNHRKRRGGFQSPIGTQKTEIEAEGEEYQVLFQSPIGTQKTLIFFKKRRFILWVSIPYRYTKNSYSAMLITAEFSFQSPIGTQKTNHYPCEKQKDGSVSIPYRYTKNAIKKVFNTKHKKGFNPL